MSGHNVNGGLNISADQLSKSIVWIEEHPDHSPTIDWEASAKSLNKLHSCSVKPGSLYSAVSVSADDIRRIFDIADGMVKSGRLELVQYEGFVADKVNEIIRGES